MIQNLEQTLIKQIEAGKKEVEESLYKAWKAAKRSDEREDLHAEIRSLDKLTFRLIKSIRGNNSGQHNEG